MFTGKILLAQLEENLEKNRDLFDYEEYNLLDLYQISGAENLCQEKCKEVLALGPNRLCDVYSNGQVVNYFEQLVATIFFDDAYSKRVPQSKWDLTPKQLMDYAFQLGSIDALNFKAAEIVKNAELYISELLKTEIGTEEFISAQKKIDQSYDALSQLTEHAFPLYWEAGYIYAAMHLTNKAGAFLCEKLELEKKKANSNLPQVMQDRLADEIKHINDKVTYLYQKILKNLSCANLLRQSSEDIPTSAHNITDQEVIAILPNNISDSKPESKDEAQGVAIQTNGPELTPTSPKTPIKKLANIISSKLSKEDVVLPVGEAELEVKKIQDTMHGLFSVKKGLAQIDESSKIEYGNNNNSSI